MSNFFKIFLQYFTFHKKHRPRDVLLSVEGGFCAIKIDAPLRADILTRDGLIQHAVFLSTEHHTTQSQQGWRRIRNRFEENFRILEKTYHLLANSVKDGEQITPGGEWLLDNYHVIEQNIHEIRTLLPKKYYASLPKLTSGEYVGLPRVYVLALEILSHTDAVVDKDLVSNFINSYQKTQILSIGELWAFPIMLRIALLENLRRLAITALRDKESENEAENLAQLIIDNEQRDATDILLDLASHIKTQPEIVPSYAAHLTRRLRLKGSKGGLALRWFEEWLSEHLKSANDLLRFEQYSQAANQISIGNSFHSLKTVLTMSWPEWFEQNSKVEEILRLDPSGIYSRSDFATRNNCRSKIEKYARQLKRSEVEIAEEALLLTRAAQDNENESTALKKLHIGFYLIDVGTSALEEKLKFSPKLLERYSRLIDKKASLVIYIGCIGMLTLIQTILLYRELSYFETSNVLLFTVILFFQIPASALSLNIVNWIVPFIVKPRVLPKMDYEFGVPDNAKTIVAVSTIFRNQEGIERTIDFLEVRFVANNDINISFALLADLADASAAISPTDQVLFNFAAQKVEALNYKYCQNAPSRFFLITRKRQWNPSEGKFMCWDRKRGKLDEFNRAILGRDEHNMIVLVGHKPLLREFKYVLTLDVDTYLPRETAFKLIGTISHPLNQAIIDPETRIVKEGYGIIQPRVGVTLVSAQKSLFSQIFAGQAGLDPYTSIVSDVYQDLFYEGSFIGKAIYDVNAFEKVLANRVPENSLLSHDLFEGIFARAALASDIELFDDFPSKYTVYSKRLHRWVRGDWQLLPWIRKDIPDSYRQLYPSPITGLGKWKLVDNLRRSLVSPFIFLFLICIWFFAPSAIVLSILVIFSITFFPVFLQLLSLILYRPLHRFLTRSSRGLNNNIYKSIAQSLLTISFLPYQAYDMCHAIVVTLYRLYVSHKDLLEWETAHQSERRLGNDLSAYFNEMFQGFLVVFITVIGLVFFSNEILIKLSPLLLLWLAAPLIAFYTGRAKPEFKYEPTSLEKQKLSSIAKETWSYFSTFLNEENNFLIPDNLQLYPNRIVAHRTSPTNISLSLLSVISAFDLKFITRQEMLEKIKKILESLSSLERYNGHFFNWYETRSKEPLRPRYISTVDSGNMAGHFITLKNALIEFSTSDIENALTYQYLIGLCDKFVKEPDFKFLYDQQKKLFYIGFRVDDARFDNYHYDLLASESRLSSLMAVATGAVSQEHWFKLGRGLTDSLGGPALLSWTGTMFEYLMPLLVMKDFPETILHSTYRSVVKAQIAYAKRLKVPWGMSESGYGGVDFEQTYQYRAFGVPGLGLKRGLSEDIVVSPYSTFLAMMVDLKESLKNIETLEAIGLRGEFGFYEAIDYTPERLSEDEDSHIVKSFLAHHQGMTLLALNNVLNSNIMQERFHRDTLVRSSELLLQERIPQEIKIVIPHQAELTFLERQEDGQRADISEIIDTPHTKIPRSRVLANEHYTLMLDNSGSGFSRYKGEIALTRWREDSLTNNYGQYFFVKDLDNNKVWSTTYLPTRVEPESYEVIFSPDKIEYKRRDGDIAIHTEVTISPEDNVEVRRITITNFSSKIKSLEITSYAEVALGSHAGDVAHQSFGKIFISSEFIEDIDALLFSRRKRSAHEEGLFLIHMLSMNICWTKTQYETSRINFLGRGSTIHNPKVMTENGRLRGNIGNILDPIFSIRTRLEIEPGTSESLSFITAVASSKDQAIFLGQLYHDPHSVTRAFEMAWSKTNVELRHEKISSLQSHLFQRIANALIFQVDELRATSTFIAQNRLLQNGLWRLGISGDLPIVLLRVDEEKQLNLVSELLLAHQYLNNRHIHFDLVILNEYTEGYLQNFQDSLDQLVRSGYSASVLDKKGGVFLRTLQQLSPEERGLLLAVARIVFSGEKGSLARQLSVLQTEISTPEENKGLIEILFKKPSLAVNTQKIIKTNSLVPALATEFFNGYGGFTAIGQAYSISTAKNGLPPLPWVNIIANPNFGFIVSESGGGFTWSENSRENRLTPWQNDPVSDQPSEVLYIRDALNGRYWSATPLPASIEAAFDIDHKFGQSIFRTEIEKIHSTLSISGSTSENVKFWKIKLVNNDNKPKRLELYLYVDWLLGINRHQTSPFLITGYDQKAKILTSVNHYNNEFAGRVVFLGTSAELSSFTTSRLEFLGRDHSVQSPSALAQGISAKGPFPGIAAFSKLVPLSKKTGVGFDSCAVLKVALTLDAAQQREVTFFMAEEPSYELAKEKAVQYRLPMAQGQELKGVDNYWKDLTTTIQVSTPERSFDILMNGWLTYQCLSCRIWGRSALYQSGGAFGFRDQLQDTMSLLYLDPKVTREQILKAAARQFVEGDVQHWWHPPTGRGVRTRISDDYLWLPYVVEKYIAVTGDKTILNEEVAFIDAPPLEKHQMEAYIVPHQSNQVESIYNHCIRALLYGLKFGPHGLPLIGAGDWNDGMNEVGSQGNGESVWLGWFLYDNLIKFSKISAERGDNAHSMQFIEVAQTLLKAIEADGWDGEWYRRAYFDDGTPLGSAQSTECQIDSIAQSWSVISGAGQSDRAEIAMSSVYERLVDSKYNLIRLLTPPFDKGNQDPGYIKGYLPGIRENGAQYTHAACWVVIATALLGKGEKAMQLWRMLNPINHTKEFSDVQRYQGEPYVMAGDVYAEAPHQGRAGWSWYTGACGWYYVAGIEYILGLKVRADHFTIEPCIPKSWEAFSMTFKHAAVTYHIEVKNPSKVETGLSSMEVDGAPLSDAKIYFEKYKEQKEVKVVVIM